MQACKLCPLLSTKPTTGSKQDDEFLDRIERLVRERDSGFGRDRSELTYLEFEGMLVWDSVVEQHERQHRARMSAMFEIMAARFAAQG